MALRETMESQGRWLFRYRSALPLLALGLVAAAVAIEEPFVRSPDRTLQLVCLGVGALGMLVRLLVAGHVPKRTSGRNTSKGQVADSLNTTGLYATVRHPLYLGNLLLWLACGGVVGVAWLVAVMGLLFWIYYERIMLAEEAFLRGQFGETFETWAARTPAFVPHPWRWSSPELGFCARTALKREYHSAYAFVVIFVVLAHVPLLIPLRRFRPDPWLLGLLAVATALWVLVRIARKRGRLSVKGR